MCPCCIFFFLLLLLLYLLFLLLSAPSSLLFPTSDRRCTTALLGLETNVTRGLNLYVCAQCCAVLWCGLDINEECILSQLFKRPNAKRTTQPDSMPGGLVDGDKACPFDGCSADT